MTIRELKKEIKGVFHPPVARYYFGKENYGTPYFWPWYYNNTILTIRKERPKFLRNKWFKLFGYEVSYGWPVMIQTVWLGWKDKYDSPRFEWTPAFHIFFFGLQFCIHWCAPDGNNDAYYEQILWWLKYSGKDINKAKETWGWVDGTTKESTWNDNYLL